MMRDEKISNGCLDNVSCDTSGIWPRSVSGFGCALHPSGFGYGLERNSTNLGDMRGNYLSVYVRRNLVVNDTHAVTNMTLSIECDGPFIAYLNGIEIIRNVSGLPGERLDVSGFIHELFPGENILAVEGSNDDINSVEFFFTPYFELTER